MSHYIIIRECKHSESSHVNEIVRNAYLSLVPTAFFNALTREITFQMIVSIAAILFIFFSVPIHYCIISIPFVLLAIYVLIYSSFLMKAVEVTTDRNPLQCWVAEACQPFYSSHKAEHFSYRIITERDLLDEGIDIGNLRRKIVGTIAIMNYPQLEETARLFRLGVHKDYRHKGIGHALVEMVKQWGRSKRYKRLILTMSECQENARPLFVSAGFQMKQMYHKHVIGSIISILMYQLECDLSML